MSFIMSNWYSPFNGPCMYLKSKLKTQDDIATFINDAIDNREPYKFSALVKYFCEVYSTVIKTDPTVVHFNLITTIMGLGRKIRDIRSNTPSSILTDYNSLIHQYYYNRVLDKYFCDFDYNDDSTEHDYLVWLDPLASLTRIFSNEQSYSNIMCNTDHIARISNSFRAMINLIISENECLPSYVKTKCLEEINLNMFKAFAFKNVCDSTFNTRSASPTSIHIMNLLLSLSIGNIEVDNLINSVSFCHKITYVDDRIYSLTSKYNWIHYETVMHDLIFILRNYRNNEDVLSQVVQYYAELPANYHIKTFKAILTIIIDQFFTLNNDTYYNENSYTYYTGSLCNDVVKYVCEKNITPSANLDEWCKQHVAPCTDDNVECNEVEASVVTEGIAFLESISFDNVDDLYIGNEASKDQSERRREVSEKLSKGSAKIHNAFRNYKDEEDKIDSQLTKIVKGTASKLVDLDTDKIRDEVVEGKKFSVIGILKKVLASVAIFSTSKVAALILIVTHFALNKKVTTAEKKRICLELSSEIEMVNEKIDDAKADGDKQAKYELMRTKHNLETALAKIRSSYKGDTAESIAAAKGVISSSKKSE